MLATSLAGMPGAPIIAHLGYSVGFLIVILSRQQLFTENTLTAVLPVMARKEARWFWTMARLWSIVLVANLIGCLLFAAFLVYSGALTHDFAARSHGQQLMANTPLEMFVKGIVAGWLIAALVWMLPSAEGTEIFVITLITYLIALGGFASRRRRLGRSALYVDRRPRTAYARCIWLFSPHPGRQPRRRRAPLAVLSYAQVREEIEER